jgi:hypothetical protein
MKNMKTSMKIENPFNYLLLLIMVLVLALTLKSCKDDEDDNGRTREKEFTVKMSADQEIPAVRNRTETATANLRLYSDSTLEFDFNVKDLQSDDQLTMAHVHAGSPVDAGAPIVTLVDNNKIKFTGASLKNSVKVSKSQYESLMNNPKDLYVNIHSVKNPLGLIRGQLETNIKFAANVDLVPFSNSLRPELGTAILRLTEDSTLIYKISINNLTPGDKLTGVSLNVGAAGVTGPALISLGTENDFGIKKSVKLSASQTNFLLNSEVYINVTSEQSPEELVRGQIR